jgi:uncharacterized protein YjbJ (UPF0337 family)
MGALSKEAIMGKEHVKGAADKAKGAMKDAAGKLTDDKELQAEGKMDKAKGSAHQALDDAKDAVKRGQEKECVQATFGPPLRSLALLISFLNCPASDGPPSTAFSSYPSRLRRFLMSSIDAACPDRAIEKRVQVLKLWDPRPGPLPLHCLPPLTQINGNPATIVPFAAIALQWNDAAQVLLLGAFFSGSAGTRVTLVVLDRWARLVYRPPALDAPGRTLAPFESPRAGLFSAATSRE